MSEVERWTQRKGIIVAAVSATVAAVITGGATHGDRLAQRPDGRTGFLGVYANQSATVPPNLAAVATATCDVR